MTESKFPHLSISKRIPIKVVRPISSSPWAHTAGLHFPTPTVRVPWDCILVNGLSAPVMHVSSRAGPQKPPPFLPVHTPTLDNSKAGEGRAEPGAGGHHPLSGKSALGFPWVSNEILLYWAIKIFGLAVTANNVILIMVMVESNGDLLISFGISWKGKGGGRQEEGGIFTSNIYWGFTSLSSWGYRDREDTASVFQDLIQEGAGTCPNK